MRLQLRVHADANDLLLPWRDGPRVAVVDVGHTLRHRAVAQGHDHLHLTRNQAITSDCLNENGTRINKQMEESAHETEFDSLAS